MAEQRSAAVKVLAKKYTLKTERDAAGSATSAATGAAAPDRKAALADRSAAPVTGAAS
jgi:hypothetical protein